MNHAFSEIELFLAMRPFVPAQIARMFAQRAFQPVDSEGNPTPDGEPPDLEVREDTLMVLTTISDETREKVAAYVLATRGHALTEDEVARWEARGKELVEAAERLHTAIESEPSGATPAEGGSGG